MSGKIKKKKVDEVGLLEARDVVVTDNWYPCYDGNKIHMRISLYKSNKIYRVIFSAFGADDFGVCMRYESSSLGSCSGIYKTWKKYVFDRVPDGVNVEWFYEHGFYCD